MKKFYTLDDLYEFCKTNKFAHFSSIETGAPLVVQTFGTFESDGELSEGLKCVKLKSCHTGKNLNKSKISDESMNTYKNSFMGRPILGSIIKTDTGEYEFHSHDMTIVENDNGETELSYIEQPVGVISQTKEPYLEYDSTEKKNYLMVEGTIFSEYSKAAEILERHGTCSCSVEIAVEEMSYDCNEDCLSIDKFRFSGVTILGFEQDGTTPVRPGMAGSNITITDFSKSNSMQYANYQNQLVEVLEKLNVTLEGFQNKNTIKEGGEDMDEFEKTVVDEEEIKEVDEAETTAETTTEEETTTEAEVSTSEDSGEETEPVTTEEEACGGKKKKKKCSVDENGNMSVSFEISHEDMRMALYNLLCTYEEEDNEWYWISNVYDDYFIYENWDGNKLYKQGYKVDEDNVAFDGDRQEMFKMILTESEKMAIDKMREDYAALESKYNELSQYKANMEQSQKDTIFASDKYVALKSSKAFTKLMEDAKNYSIQECSQKADELLDEAKKLVEQFAAVKPIEESGKPKTINIPFNAKEKKSAYGGLFDQN